MLWVRHTGTADRGGEVWQETVSRSTYTYSHHSPPTTNTHPRGEVTILTSVQAQHPHPALSKSYHAYKRSARRTCKA